MGNIGIIDLGSNSARIGIYDLTTGNPVYMGKCPVRLSEGMNCDMLLKDKAISRTIVALIGFLEIMEKLEVTEVYAFATAAVRKAKNQAEFIEKVRNETGISIRVLSGEEEAEFDFSGVMGKTGLRDAVILDTGGGSIEFIGARNGQLSNARSIQIGSRSIKELFFEKGEKPDAKRQAKAKVEEILDSLPWLNEFENVPIIGIGGCNRTVARICLGDKDRDKVIESYTVDRAKVFEIFRQIEETAVDKRELINGITSDRTDIIYGGLLPLAILMERLNSPCLVVTDAGLKEGILKKIMGNF